MFSRGIQTGDYVGANASAAQFCMRANGAPDLTLNDIKFTFACKLPNNKPLKTPGHDDRLCMHGSVHGSFQVQCTSCV